MYPKKVLVIRFSSIGDIVLTTPVVRALKTQFPDAGIHYLTKAAYEGILEENPYIDRYFLLDKNLNAIIRQLKSENYDLIVDLHNNIRTAVIKFILGVESQSFDKLNFKKWLLVNFKIDRLPNRHIVDRYMDTVAHLGIKADMLGLDFFIPEKDRVLPEQLPETHRKGYVAFAIGAQHFTKKLPTARIIELCDKINKPVVLLGDAGDASAGKVIERFFARSETSRPVEEGLEALGKKTVVYNACGKYTLNGSASLIKNAWCVFTHDTGLMHIAAAFKKEVFSIWGNTVPGFGMYPYRTRFTIFENNELRCRPCSKIGYDRCPKGHFKCMNDISFDF